MAKKKTAAERLAEAREKRRSRKSSREGEPRLKRSDSVPYLRPMLPLVSCSSFSCPSEIKSDNPSE